MASISTEANGRKMIRFKAPNGKRPKIRLGKIDPRVAEEIKGHVEHLANCWTLVLRGVRKKPCEDTDLWIGDLLTDPNNHWLYDRLSAAGLVGAREKPDSTRNSPKKTDEKPMPNKLGAFVDAYIDSRTDVKEGTITNYKQVRSDLVEFFGAGKRLVDVSPGDADEFRRWLRAKHADNTTRRRCGRAKQFFRVALRKRLIPENPFGDMKHLNVKANKKRQFFVTRQVTHKVLGVMIDSDESPLVQWQLILALNRYGALRCPSETSAMLWDDVDWDNNAVTVRSPKTEHHEGKESRVMPLFPELRPYLEAAFNEAERRLGRPPSPTDHVIAVRYRGAGKNLGTQLKRFLKRAGVSPWPKLLQNLRASRATELAKVYPEWMVAAWCGHSKEVAEEHYWQITDADWQRAASQPTGEQIDCEPSPPTNVEEGVEKAGQKVGPKHPENGPKPECRRATENRKSLQNSDLENRQMTPTGLEPVLPA